LSRKKPPLLFQPVARLEDVSTSIISKVQPVRLRGKELFRRTFFIGVIVLLLTSALILNGLLRIQSVIASPSPPRIDNLIITASDLEAAASRLAQWKNSSGIISRVLDVEWINSTYSGVDEQERIRNCIRDFYSSFQTKYVTIFGDTDKVPIRYVYIPDGVDDPLVPTDLYYADLNYTWDDNRDGIYGDLEYQQAWTILQKTL
jgi:hypothetical protein